MSGSSLPSGAITGNASSGEGPLGAPSLRTDVFGGSVLLSWIPPLRTSGSLQYHVYRQLAGVNNPEQIATNLSTISFIDLTAVPGLIYEYYVVTVRNGSVSAASNLQLSKAISPFNMQQPLQDPSGNLIIAWAPAVGADEYVVVSGSGNGDFSNVLQSNAVSPVVISNPPTGETFYKILAKNSVGTGATVSSSNVYRGTTMGNFTAALDITTVGHLYLTWTTATNAQQYVVRVGTTSGNYTQTLGTVTASPFDVVGLTANQVYYARVFALNQGVMLPSSNEVVLTYALPTEYLWPFSTLTESQYSPSGGWVDLELSSGVCRLKPTAHIDNDDIALGFAGGTKNQVTWGAARAGSGSALGLSSSAAPTPFPLASLPRSGGLVGYWRFDETAAATAPSGRAFADSYSHGNHLTGSTGISFGNQMQIQRSVRNAAYFDGVSTNVYREHDLNNTFTSFQWYGEYTMSGWFNTVDVNIPYQMLMTKYYDGGYVAFECRIEPPSINIRCYHHVADGSLVYVDSSVRIQPNRWYHFAATYDGREFRIYIDGVLNGKTVVSTGAQRGVWLGTNSNINHNIYFGRRFDGYLFKGFLSDFAFWNSRLDGNEVKTVYEMGRSTGCDARVSDCLDLQSLSASWTPKYGNILNYWKFEKNWNDSIGGKNGTVVGDPEYVGFGLDGKVGTHSAVFHGRGFYTGGAEHTYVSIPNTGTWSFGTSNFTVGYWFKKDNLDGESYSIGFGGGTNNMAFLHDNPTYKAWVYVMGGGASRVWTTEKYSDGFWHYLTYTRESGTARLYIDAKLVDQQTVSDSINVVGPLTIGTYGNAGFIGQLDDLAIWNTHLTAGEVKTIFDRQRHRLKSGEFVSRVMDGGAVINWTDLSWQSSLPHQKATVDGSAQESTSVYPGLVNNSMKNGILGLYHMDEVVQNSAPGATDFADASGNGLAAAFDLESSVFYGDDDSVFGRSAKFNDKQNRILLNFGPTNPTILTFSFWMKWDGQESVMPVGAGYAYDLVLFGGCLGFNTGASDCLGTNSVGLVNRWVHVVAEFHSGSLNANKIYLDGVEQKLSQLHGAPSLANANPSYLVTISGWRVSNGYGFTGNLDEVAIFNRSLSAAEVQQWYARGASRVKFQVKSCAAADCSDATWKGPDGTANTFFTEAFNRSTQAPTASGSYLATGPSMLFSNFMTPPSSNRYFQYRAVLESDSHLPQIQPEIRSVSIGPVTYSGSAPSVVTQNGFSYLSLAQFTETLGGNGCAGGVMYNLSPDKTTWYYWNGTTWAVANGTPAQANPATDVSTQISAYGSQIGVGTVYLKAYLQSNGTTPCELDLIQLLGTQ